jgi:phage/plasmid-like protein (TIGR03299 family)
MSLLDQILANPKVVSSQHDPNKINWVNGLTDPGEMIACGYLPQARRLEGEQDAEYAARIEAIIAALPKDQQRQIRNQGAKAAKQRAALDTRTGRVAAAFAVQPGWHQLGTVFDKSFTTTTLKGMPEHNFVMEKRPCLYRDPKTGEILEDEDNFHIWRTDTWQRLTVKPVGSKFQIIQNDQAWEFLDEVVGEFGASYESAGSVYGGKQSWAQIHMPNQTFAIGKHTHVEPYILYFKRNDGSGKDVAFPTAIRAECANTTRLALSKKGDKGIGLRHSGSIKDKIEEARLALGLSVERFEQFKEQTQVLARTTADEEQLEYYCNDVLDAALDITAADMQKGVDVLAKAVAKTTADLELARKSVTKKIERRLNVLEDILDRYESRTNDGCRGTLEGCYNAVAESADHGKLGGRYKGDQEKRASRQFLNVVQGEADDVKQIALQKALALTA